MVLRIIVLFPVCGDLQPLRSVKNGYPILDESETYPPGKNVSFKCNKGYKLSGDITASICTEELQWSSPLPECVKGISNGGVSWE